MSFVGTMVSFVDFRVCNVLIVSIIVYICTSTNRKYITLWKKYFVSLPLCCAVLQAS